MFAAQKQQHGYLLAWICNATAYVLQCLNTKHPKYYLRVREAQHKICHTRMQKENMVATLEALLTGSGASSLCHCFFSLKDKTMETVFCFWNQFLKSFITKSLLGLCCCSAAAVVVTPHQPRPSSKQNFEAPPRVCHLCCCSIDHFSLQEYPSPSLLLIYRSSLIARRPISTSLADISIISHCKKTHLHLCCWSIDRLSLQEDPSPLQDKNK